MAHATVGETCVCLPDGICDLIGRQTREPAGQTVLHLVDQCRLFAEAGHVYSIHPN